MTEVHPTAFVEDGAELDDDVSIGPFSVVGSGSRIGRGSRLESHVVVTGRTTLGEGCRVFPFACLGHRPQDLKYRGEETTLDIGSNNQIREHVTMHPGTAHDCQIGNGVIMANNATLAGHVELADFAFLGGLSAVHQFVRIGTQAMIGGLAGVENDVIPYGMVLGNRAYLNGLNIIGMKRRGLDRDEIQDLRNAYRQVFSSDGTFADRLSMVGEQFPNQPRVIEMIDFIRDSDNRSICLPRASRANS
jgi:UDP-N-acetylglucosamine acyltransferase